MKASHPTSPDEKEVNVHLVLLIQELVNLKRSSSIQCTVTRVRFVPKFGTQSYTAVVDGVVQSRRTDKVLSILEVKPTPRFGKQAPVQMQETAEAVGWLKHQSEGVPKLQEGSRLIIYQGKKEVFLTLAAPGARYVEYLARTVPTTTAEPEEFMKMQSFGPWSIKKETHLQSLCWALLAFLSAAEEVAH
ncbi:hypothetical protein Aspvir_009505 [Aspergillus viridinutans]|uniref:Uncharacterized protein n=1 Tax=Aspergillus viridinutans TaxID=75553 RepID=A0A9P3F8V1_ASPVI|nr:uncharacterized protein Aspvir_009505 [Aspergillus viridinutans]GIK05396.1 hypothetical protein Aspvir_009505 [Aspergillus viridinutans]